ncbi:MAG: hypothetical protein A3B44_03235 [Candidatus Levybacteria bacterium RIFCSPLOWO2_01_FULL_38_21]|nr:MAG: hypothetical protein A3B44_03235 [Candidatus Levybacteria bacterium RIFCSPLOWO2_01_FULL_38_21]
MTEAVGQSSGSAREANRTPDKGYGEWFDNLLASLDSKIAEGIEAYPSLAYWSREVLVGNQLLSTITGLERGNAFRDRLTRLYKLFEVAIYPNLNPNEQRELRNHFRMSRMQPDDDMPLTLDEQLMGDLQQLWRVCRLDVPTDEQKNDIPEVLKQTVVDFDSLVYQGK